MSSRRRSSSRKLRQSWKRRRSTPKRGRAYRHVYAQKREVFPSMSSYALGAFPGYPSFVLSSSMGARVSPEPADEDEDEFFDASSDEENYSDGSPNIQQEHAQALQAKAARRAARTEGEEEAAYRAMKKEQDESYGNGSSGKLPKDKVKDEEEDEHEAHTPVQSSAWSTASNVGRLGLGALGALGRTTGALTIAANNKLRKRRELARKEAEQAKLLEIQRQEFYLDQQRREEAFELEQQQQRVSIEEEEEEDNGENNVASEEDVDEPVLEACEDITIRDKCVRDCSWFKSELGKEYCGPRCTQLSVTDCNVRPGECTWQKAKGGKKAHCRQKQTAVAPRPKKNTSPETSSSTPGESASVNNRVSARTRSQVDLTKKMD